MVKKQIVVLFAAFLCVLTGCTAEARQRRMDCAETPAAAPAAIFPQGSATSGLTANYSERIADVLAGETGIARLHDFNDSGIKRSYLLYIPENLPMDASLVFVLHGYYGFAASFMNAIGMNAIADKGGFGVVYPQGLTSKSTEFPGTHWNADLTFTDVDDTGFLAALAAYLQERYGFSRDRTFAAGLSNGGFMCYTLAVRSPNTFRAIASIAGTMSGGTWKGRGNAAPVPVLQIHGTADHIVPIDGSMATDGGWGGAPKMDDIIKYWTDRNGADSVIEDMAGNISACLYANSDGKYPVWYYRIGGFGHNWPTVQTTGLDASELIWKFFSSLQN